MNHILSHHLYHVFIPGYLLSLVYLHWNKSVIKKSMWQMSNGKILVWKQALRRTK